MIQPASAAVLVLGGGGHAKVVISTLRAAGFAIEGAFDDDPAKTGCEILGVPVRGPIAHVPDEPNRRCVAAVGINDVREQIVRRLRRVEWIVVRHPSAYVDPSVLMGPGSVVFAGAVVQPGTCIGAHVIVNTGAIIDHDCEIDDFAHIAPGTHVAGGVRVGRAALLGIGSSVAPGVEIGPGAILGAGGVLVRDLPAQTIAVGVPARPRPHDVSSAKLEDAQQPGR